MMYIMLFIIYFVFVCVLFWASLDFNTNIKGRYVLFLIFLWPIVLLGYIFLVLPIFGIIVAIQSFIRYCKLSGF